MELWETVAALHDRNLDLTQCFAAFAGVNLSLLILSGDCDSCDGRRFI